VAVGGVVAAKQQRGMAMAGNGGMAKISAATWRLNGGNGNIVA